MERKLIKNKKSYYQLKIKAISLADEAKTIRRLELDALAKAKSTTNPLQKRIYNAVFNSLYRHRIDVVRFESRATHIARAFLSGKKFSDIEKNRNLDYHLSNRVYKIVKKYSSMENVDTKELVLQWINET